MAMIEFTRTYAVIHLDAIRRNIDNAVKRIGSGVKIMAIVKANAYGHGAVPVARAIKDKVYGFAVATVKEALELRRQGIDNHILVLGYVCREEYEVVIRNGVTFALLTSEMANDISDCAQKLNMTARCHIKVNTGMNRIGFPVNEDSMREIEQIHELPGLYLEGIFMHFATADEADKEFSRAQFGLFMEMVNELSKRGVNFDIKHCCNSAGIIDLSEYALDMVREGIMLYGLKPSLEVDASMEYSPALELKSHVIFVKELPAGEGVSYGRTYITEAPTKVATVAIGYADGYPRSLSSKGSVLIRGKRAPIIGRICMDQMMVDVTGIDGVAVEDIVTLIGKDGGEYISVEELSELSGRFNYEFVCDLSERVERKYVD